MKTLLRILILVIVSLRVGFAQQSTLSGTICTEKEEPIADASIFFLQEDSLIAGAVTDAHGGFSLKMNTGKYRMQVSFLGFDEYSEEITLSPAAVKLPPVALRYKAVTLDEAVVSADKIPYAVEQNREIFTVPSLIKKSSADIYQIFMHVPALKVNLNERKIDIAGVSNMLVMVNNIHREQAYLLTIDPDEVEKVEVIRNTGVRYGSQNIDGILHVITKPRDAGTQRMSMGVQLHPGMAYSYMDGSYSYASDRFSASLMASYFFFNEKERDISILREVRSEGDLIRTEKNTDLTRYKMHSPYVMGNMNYNISDKMFTTLGFYYNGSPAKMVRPYQGSVFTNDEKSYDFRSNSLDDSKYNSYGVNYYWQTQFDENHSFNVQADYSQTQIKQTNLFEEWRDVDSMYTRLGTDNKEKQQKVDLQANYRQQIGKHLFETGYRFYKQYNRFDGLSEIGLNQLRYDEWRNYLYAGLSGNLTEKWSYQLGVGYDWVKTDVNKEVTNRFHELTPNLRIGYTINSTQSIGINYSRNRRSPSFSNLNPNPIYSDTSYIYYGNPYLKPYYINSLRLNYQLGNSRFYLMVAAQYEYVNNFIVTKEFLNEDNIFINTVDNAGRYSSVSGNLNFSVNVLKWWKISMNGTMARRSYKDDNEVQFNKNFWVPSLWVSSMINYDKLAVSFDYGPTFRTRTLTGYVKTEGESSLNASYNLTSNIGITLGCRYLFPMKYKKEIYEDNFMEITQDNMVERSWRVLVGFRLYFQKGKQRGYKQKSAKQYNDVIDIGGVKY